MSTPDEVVFLLEVDNTLLDNDHVEADLKKYLDLNRVRCSGRACGKL
jgi:hypothetical protein